jgi:hypothetical protein
MTPVMLNPLAGVLLKTTAQNSRQTPKANDIKNVMDEDASSVSIFFLASRFQFINSVINKTITAGVTAPKPPHVLPLSGK